MKPAARSDRIADLPNLGPRSAAMLAAAGVRSAAALRRLGAVRAYRRVRQAQPGASLNLLYALVGALERRHWRDVQRRDRLTLLLAVDAPARRRPSAAGELRALRNVGPAMERDLHSLGITRVAQLARTDADRLYRRLCARTGVRQDPCVWDTFAAAVHQARTGEALPWWHFTAERKRRVAAGELRLAANESARESRAGRPVRPRAGRGG